MKIEELCKKVVLAKLEAGYSECTAWSRYKDFYSPMISLYKSCGEDEFSLEMMVRYQEHSHDRMEHGEIGEHRYHAIMRGKGSKIRTVPLMKKTMGHFENYVKIFHPTANMTSMGKQR